MSILQPRSSRILRVGGVAKSDLLNQLCEAGVGLNPLALALFSNDGFLTSAEQRTLRLAQRSVAQLGLSQGGTFDEIAARALAQGLSLCPLELGPHYRLAFPDQEEGALGQALFRDCAPPGSVTVASQPISADDDMPKGFYLRVIQGVPWLRGYRSWPGHIWSPSDVLAFTETQSAA